MISAPVASSQPIATLLTPRGRGAVATVQLIGDCGLIDQSTPQLFRAANGKSVEEQPIDRIVFGQWGREISEDVVLCRTANNITEIHCHGGEAAATAILSDLESRGSHILQWGEQSTQSTGVFETECLEALTRATTARTADLLLEQQSGVLRRGIEQIRQAIQDSGPVAMQATIDRIDALLDWAEFGLHLSEPWQVVIAGRPNVGKSSLINALVGFSRSIVYDRPGTTRDVVTAETALDGWPIRFSDTAGLRDEGDAIELAGIERARATLVTADCRILVFDTSRILHDEDRQLRNEWPNAIQLAHKCDLPPVWPETEFKAALPVSSVAGTGLDELANNLITKLVPHVPPPGRPIPVTGRQIDLLKGARNELSEDNTANAIELLDELLQ